ncbi:MAG TPA: DUF5947 family protein [Candidatus Limnocylindrales bacterium]|nr:DUF5947 family protein [Candidatus Limnocylindrales bacterium]
MTIAPEQLTVAIARVESIRDEEARAAARAAVSAVLALHGEGLRRLCLRLREEAAGGRVLGDAARDEVVASVLAVHGLHPLSVRERVEQAVNVLSAGRACGSIEIVSLDDAAARLRVRGGHSLRQAVADAVGQAAPELELVEVVEEEPAPCAARTPAALRHDRCHLCSQPLGDEHEHLIDSRDRRLECTCTACALLFDAPGAKVRRVRRRTLALEGFCMSDAQWAALEVPVGLVFFTYSSAMDQVVASYPGPAGPIESLVPKRAWNDVVRSNPVLAGLQPDCEALLAQRLRHEPSYHILSIDECYRLSALVRTRWQGITGGDGPIRAVEEFFGRVAEAAA